MLCKLCGMFEQVDCATAPAVRSYRDWRHVGISGVKFKDPSTESRGILGPMKQYEKSAGIQA